MMIQKSITEETITFCNKLTKHSKHGKSSKKNLCNYFSNESLTELLSPFKIRFSQNSIFLSTSNSLILERFTNEILPTVNQIKNDKDLNFIEICVKSDNSLNFEEKNTTFQQNDRSAADTNRQQTEPTKYTVFSSKLSRSTGLNPNYTFENFKKGHRTSFHMLHVLMLPRTLGRVITHFLFTDILALVKLICCMPLVIGY